MDTATPTKDSEALASMVIQSTAGLPAELQVAQGAIGLPEVQAMLRRLADFNLGIYMPHLHEDETGRFLPLPDGLIQVEDDLTVTFQTEQPPCGSRRGRTPVGSRQRPGRRVDPLTLDTGRPHLGYQSRRRCATMRVGGQVLGRLGGLDPGIGRDWR